jgi:hypothetical protein
MEMTMKSLDKLGTLWTVAEALVCPKCDSSNDVPFADRSFPGERVLCKWCMLEEASLVEEDRIKRWIWDSTARPS